MRWAIIGLPLVLIGFACLWGANRDSDLRPGYLLFAAYYLGASLCALSPIRAHRNITLVAWVPLLLVIPVGTAWGALAITWLMQDSRTERQSRHRISSERTPEQLEQLIRSRAVVELDISDDQFGIPAERELLVPPVDWIHFLDDLRVDHGLPVSSDDRRSVATVDDVVRIVQERLSREAKSQPTSFVCEPVTAPEIAPSSPYQAPRRGDDRETARTP